MGPAAVAGRIVRAVEPMTGKSMPEPGTDTAGAPARAAEGASPQGGARLELERAMRAQLAQVTGGLAPDVYANAWWDWFLNLAKEPPKQIELAQDAMQKAADSFNFALKAAAGTALKPQAGDERMGGDAWAHWPFNVYAHAYRNYADWWNTALSSVPGVAPGNERTLDFLARNALEAVSPANYLATNPELLEATRAEAGQNLVRGLRHWLEDAQRMLGAKAAKPGADVRRGPRHRRDARQGRAAQRSHRIDPVFAGDGRRYSPSPS